MGDNLAEELYRALVNAMGSAYGSDEHPSFHNLDSEKRYAWDRVAAAARRRVKQQCLDDVTHVIGEFGEAGASMLEERWLGKREVER